MRKVIKYLLPIMVAIILASCSDKKGYEVVFNTASGKTTEDNTIFYTNDRGTIFLKLDDDLVSTLNKQPITRIEFKINDKSYIGEPIDQFFSREKPSSDFVFGVKNQTKDLVIDVIDGNSFIVIVSEKTSIENLVSEGILVAYKINQ